MEWLGTLFEWLSDAFDTSDGDSISLGNASNAISNATQSVVDLVDSDCSGDISPADVVKGVNNVFDLDGSGSVNSNDLTQAVLSFIDKNGSGQLESEDFKQLLIGFLDRNGDGQLSSVDTAIRKAAAEVGENFGPIAKSLFGAAAKNVL
ncbi:MAG: hypothetical protein Kow00121_58950 [Elainellaceae cyanobacterium]